MSERTIVLLKEGLDEWLYFSTDKFLVSRSHVCFYFIVLNIFAMKEVDQPCEVIMYKFTFLLFVDLHGISPMV